MARLLDLHLELHRREAHTERPLHRPCQPILKRTHQATETRLGSDQIIRHHLGPHMRQLPQLLPQSSLQPVTVGLSHFAHVAPPIAGGAQEPAAQGTGEAKDARHGFQPIQHLRRSRRRLELLTPDHTTTVAHHPPPSHAFGNWVGVISGHPQFRRTPSPPGILHAAVAEGTRPRGRDSFPAAGPPSLPPP